MKKSKRNYQAKIEQKIAAKKAILDVTALEQASGGCCCEDPLQRYEVIKERKNFIPEVAFEFENGELKGTQKIN